MAKISDQPSDSRISPYEQLTGSYAIDPVHSTLGFSVRHAMISHVRGRFDSFEGLLKLDGSRPALSEARVSVQSWGPTWNTALETGGVLVSDKVTPVLDISAVQVAQTDG